MYSMWVADPEIPDEEENMDYYDEWEDDGSFASYTPSATAGDYSPSHPWDAPGMSISDFI